jgi:hypothetical protein
MVPARQELLLPNYIIAEIHSSVIREVRELAGISIQQTVRNGDGFLDTSQYLFVLITEFQIVRQDDHIPMQAETTTDVTTVLDTVWLQESEKREISSAPTPQLLPWSQSFFLCCQDVRVQHLLLGLLSIFNRFAYSSRSFMHSLKGFLGITVI